MSTSASGPYPVSKGDVLTGVIVEGGDTVRTLAIGWVSFARVVGRTFDANGDDWSTPADFPAPHLRKHSLIVKFGAGPWYQGGTDRTISVPPGQSGEIVMRTNDHDDWLWDNDNFWAVSLVVSRPDPPPPQPGPPQPALSIVATEVVQVIQRAGNAVRLVRGKRTVVRVYVDSGLRSGEDVGVGPNRWPGVAGSVTIVDGMDGSTLATVTTPLNSGGVVTARAGNAIEREQWSHSLNFELPPSVLNRPALELRARAWTTTPAASTGNSTESLVRVTLEARATQPLLPILIELANPAIALPAPTMADFNAALVAGVMPRFPVAEAGFAVRPPFFWRTENDLREETHWNGLLQQMATLRLLSSDPVDGIRCGVIPSGSWPLGGKGAPHVWGSWVPAFVANVKDSVAVAHELAHTFGVWHSNCSGTEGDYDRRNFPGRIDDVGINVATRTVIRRLTPDLMSYCRNGEQWPAVQVYDALLNEGII